MDANQSAGPSGILRDERGALLHTQFPLPLRRGKVRDVYDLGDRLWIVSSDRISAFDHILPVGIPGKGALLTNLSKFWFTNLDQAHHWTGQSPAEVVPKEIWGGFTHQEQTDLDSRSMITLKAEVVPFECVVRGYLEGSGWKDYQANGSVCGHALPPGLLQCAKLPQTIFTPATKADSGHDENVDLQTMVESLGSELANRLRKTSLHIYQQASQIAQSAGIIIADTKFEFGHIDSPAGKELILIDEVLTPDSSRFWLANNYKPGGPQPSMDKQFVREWLEATDWDKASPPPKLPDEVVDQTIAKYQQALERLTSASA